jgi:hypothetical protein
MHREHTGNRRAAMAIEIELNGMESARDAACAIGFSLLP